jgi:hypothetical protein
MKTTANVLFGALFLFIFLLNAATNVVAAQSVLARITGIDIDVHSRTVEIKPPDLGAVPDMVRNLPKDVGQALLNPASPILAAAIRESRSQALRRGVQPVPAAVKQRLAPYFPPPILNNARWTTANGVSVDGMLKNMFNQDGAVTFDDVIVFSDAALTTDIELWAHELTHVMQYGQVGIDTFAFLYSTNWNGIESDARANASNIMQSINSVSAGGGQSYSYAGAPAAASQQLNWQVMNEAAKLAIPATDCIWINNQNNTTGNRCPVPIMVTGVIMRRFADGYTFTFPCDEPTCLFRANSSDSLLSPPGHVIIGVTAAFEIK